MKNIHIIPSDKSSRLIKDIWNNTFSIVENFNIDHTDFKPQYIYITNDEEIKVGDWCYQVELNDGKVDKCYDVTLYHTWTNNGVDKTRKFKKIILTTDSDLIKDGVQSIDDTFIEWYIQNSRCEYVKTEKWLDDEGRVIYSRIIPKQKQHLIDMMKVDEELGLYKQERSYSEEDMIDAAKYGYNFHKTTSFPKQEFEDSCIRNTQQWLTTFKK